LTEYKKKSDADKKKASIKTSGSNGAKLENRDGQTAALTAAKLGVNVTVLAGTGSDYSDISRSVAGDARKQGFPLKIEVLPKPIMLKWLSGAKATNRSAVRRRCSCGGKDNTLSEIQCMRGVR
jgi:hypothetical protein